MVCVHKNAQARKHVTNVKTDQQGRAERGAMVPRHSTKKIVFLKISNVVETNKKRLSFSQCSNNHIQYVFVVTALHEIEAINEMLSIKISHNIMRDVHG